MRAYLVIMGCIAVVSAAMFGLANRWGARIYNMWAWFGVAAFFVVGAVAVADWQAAEAYRRLKETLKRLEPRVIITDLSERKRPGRKAAAQAAPPDLVLVAPGGVAAVVLDDLPDHASEQRAHRQLKVEAERARAGAEWLRGKQGEARPPVVAVLVMMRRLSSRDDVPPGVALVNPEVIPAWLEATLPGTVLNREQQVRLTQLYRTG